MTTIIGLENIGDDDANLWLATAQSNGHTAHGIDRDSFRARELAIEKLTVPANFENTVEAFLCRD